MAKRELLEGIDAKLDLIIDATGIGERAAQMKEETMGLKADLLAAQDEIAALKARNAELERDLEAATAPAAEPAKEPGEGEKAKD